MFTHNGEKTSLENWENMGMKSNYHFIQSHNAYENKGEKFELL